MELTTEQRDAIVIPLAHVIEEDAEVDFWEVKDDLTNLLEFGSVDQWDQTALACLEFALKLGGTTTDELAQIARAFTDGREHIQSR